MAGGGPPAERSGERVVEGASQRALLTAQQCCSLFVSISAEAAAVRHRTLIRNRARALRGTMSEPEVMLWTRLRGRGEGHSTFRRQHPIESIIVDFYCPAARLAVEVDGSTHWSDEQRRRDQARDGWLQLQGISVLRIPASAIYRDLTSVADGVLRRAEQLVGTELRRPAPSTTRSSASGPPPAIAAAMGEVD
jgi:very-short-patch-repair endonuclease